MMVRVRARGAARCTAVTAATPLLVLGLALAGCSPQSEPASVRSDASPSPRPAATQRAHALVAPDGEQVPAPGFVRTVSRSLNRTTTARIALDLLSPGVTLSGHGAVDYTGSSPSVRIFATVPALGAGTIEARLVDRVFYVTMPMIDDSGTFYRVDLTQPATGLEEGLGGTHGMGALDPREALHAFGSGVRHVVRVGSEMIGGVRTERYWVSADGTALRTLLGQDPGAQVPDRFSFDVWLDDEQRVRRVAADLGRQGSLEMRLSRWGSPVSITAPPPSRVQEMPRG